MKRCFLFLIVWISMVSCEKEDIKQKEEKTISTFEEYVEYTIKSESIADDGSLWIQNPSLNLSDPTKQGIVDTLLFKNGICYKHSTLDGWAYSIENGKFIFSKDGESKTFTYSSKGKDCMVFDGFEGISITNMTDDVQYVKVKESSKKAETNGNVIFYTNAHEVINTPGFLVTNVFIDSTFAGTLTDSYSSQENPPVDNYETDARVLNIPLSMGEHSFYAFFGISSGSHHGIKGTFIITKDECTKIFLDAFKSTNDL